MNIIQGSTALLIGYLFGCFQTSYFISKWIKKADIRKMGSGNAGASNVTSEFHPTATSATQNLRTELPSSYCIYSKIFISTKKGNSLVNACVRA